MKKKKKLLMRTKDDEIFYVELIHLRLRLDYKCVCVCVCLKIKIHLEASQVRGHKIIQSELCVRRRKKRLYECALMS